MPTLTLSTTVAATPERTFAAFSDLERAAENISAITNLEILTEGPVGVGTRFRETRIMFKREATETMEITAFDPPRSYTVEANSCGARFGSTFRFTPDPADPARTLVEFEMRITAETFMAKLMSPLTKLMMGTMRKCMEQDMADMKRAAEAPAGQDGEAAAAGGATQVA